MEISIFSEEKNHNLIIFKIAVFYLNIKTVQGLMFTRSKVVF